MSLTLVTLAGERIAHAGCEKDTDCKGDRVCSAGVCTEPSPPSSGDKTAGTVMVHVVSNEPAAVLSRVTAEATATASGPGGMASASASEYQVVCGVPCDTAVPINKVYVFQKVSGSGQVSGTFTMPARDRLTLNVDSGSQGMYFLGFMGELLGIMAGVGGLLVVPAGVALHNDGLTIAGGITAGAGAIVTVLSILTLNANGTHVTTDTGERLASHPNETEKTGLRFDGGVPRLVF